MFISEILKYKVKFTKYFFDIDILPTIFIIILYIIISSSYYFIKRHNNIIIGLINLLLIIYFILIIINFKLSTNIHFSNKYINPMEIYDNLNTGDLVFFRCYEYDKLDRCLMEAILLLQNTYFTHIGIIYRDSNKKYIL